MATFIPQPNGKVKTLVRLKGVYKCKTLPSMGKARAWATITEAEIESGKLSKTSELTVGDMLAEYRIKKTATKRGRRSEELRLDRLERDDISKVLLQDVGKKHISAWRDRRLKSVSALSVLREWTTLSHAFKTAINEWEWDLKYPMSGVDKPSKPPARTRRAEGNELERVIYCSGWDQKSVPRTATARVGAAVEFVVETALRCKEVCGLDKKRDIQGRVAKVVDSKTESGIREVPLSKRALEIVELLKKVDLPGDSLFHLNESQVDALYRKIRKRAVVQGLRFHDLRAEACTRLARKLSPLQLAKVLGHSDVSKLMIYYREKAEDIAEMLD